MAYQAVIRHDIEEATDFLLSMNESPAESFFVMAQLTSLREVRRLLLSLPMVKELIETETLQSTMVAWKRVIKWAELLDKIYPNDNFSLELKLRGMFDRSHHYHLVFHFFSPQIYSFPKI